MSDYTALEQAFARIGERDRRYHERGLLFVLAALEYAQGKHPARRHRSGQELAWACRDFALEQFGLLAPTVLRYWGIGSTEDIGCIVFHLIDVGPFEVDLSVGVHDFNLSAGCHCVGA